MTNTITISAAEIVERFKSGETDFTDLGKIRVEGDVRLGDVVLKNDVSLGQLQFGYFYCDNATFADFCCHSATFADFSCDSATFADFSCGDATFADFSCGYAAFEMIVANSNPAVAWVIQQYKSAGVHYDIKHAPPWLQKQPTE
jgi:hypothetical protein